MRPYTRILLAGAAIAACGGCTRSAPAEGGDGGIVSESGFVDAGDGVRLYYRTVGDGPQDVVIPVAVYLDSLLLPLASPDRRLIFYDLRARGRSDAGDRSLITIDRQLADLEALRTGLAIDSMAVIGWSGLGMEMFVYALRHPERVSGLVQVAPVAARDEPHNATAYATRAQRIDTATQRILQERQAQGDFAGDPTTHCRELRTLTSPANFADPAFAAAVPDPCRFPNEYPDSLGALFTSLLGSFAGYDWREAARAMPIRRLVIHGRQDAFPIEGSREWVPPGSNARLLVIDSAGHFPFVERPDVFFPAVDAFLRGGWPDDATAPAVGSGQ